MILAMGLLIIQYLRWHYAESLRDLLHIWGNLLWFGYHFFSFRLLLRTLIAPYHLVRETSGRRSVELSVIAENIVYNIAMRIIGFVARIFLLVAGTLFEAIVITAGTVAFITWFALPAVVIGLLIAGVTLLI